jgi:hypothetical protein
MNSDRKVALDGDLELGKEELLLLNEVESLFPPV